MFLSRYFSLCFIASSFLLVCSGVFAKETQWSSDVHHGQLENGFQYVVYNSGDSSDPFNLRLIVNAGSVDDEQRGMAHIVEHMVFRSNRAHSIDMHRLFDQIGWKTGTQINAMTRQTETQYMVRTRPHDALDAAQSVKLLSDLAFGAKMTDREWQIERGVILEEMRRGAGVAERVNIAKKAVVRNGSRYVDRPTIGTSQAILNVDIKDIRAFYDTFYVPGNMTLVASGYFDVNAFIESIKQTFGAQKAAPVPDRSYVKLPLKEGLVIGKVQDPMGTTSAVVYGFRSAMKAKVSEEGAYQRLQNYFIRKLVQPLVRASLAQYDDPVSSVHITFSEPTNERLIAAVAVKTTDHEKGQEIVLKEIERLKQNGIDPADLAALKEKAKAVVERNRKIIPQRDYAQWEDKLTAAVMQDSVEEDYEIKAARTLQWIDGLTVETLNQRLNAILSAPDQFMFYQIPGGVVRTLPTAEHITQLKQRLAQQRYDAIEIVSAAQASSKTDGAEPDAKQDPGTSAVSLTKPVLDKPRVKSKHKYSDPAVVQWKLANGDSVIWLDRETSDGELYVKALSNAGYNSDAYPPWLLQSAQQIWQQTDFTRLSNQALQDWQEAHQATWSWAQTGRQLDLSAKVTEKSLEPLMRAYWLAQTDWIFDQVQFAPARDAIRDSVQAVSPQASERADLWGTLPGASPTATDIDALTFNDVKAAIQWLNQQPVSLFIVGKTSESHIERSVLPYLASVKRKADYHHRPSGLPSGFHRLNQAIHQENKATVTIKSEANMVWSPERSFLISTLNPIAQKALKNKLRHELGGVYSIHFEMSLQKDNKVHLLTEFTTAPEKVELLLKAHNQVLDRLSEQLPMENYQRIQNDIKFAESLRLEDTNTWLRRLALSYERYQGPDYLQSMHTLDRHVTEQELTELVEGIFPLSNQAVLVGLPLSETGM